MKVTNTTKGIKSIWSRRQNVMVSIDPGATVLAYVDKAERDADVGGYFKFDFSPLDHDHDGRAGGFVDHETTAKDVVDHETASDDTQDAPRPRGRPRKAD